MIETDAQLVERTLSGDDSAFDELVSRYRTRVYHLALSMVRSREAASDLAQEAFVQAYMSLQTLRDPARFSSWLYSITANACRMHMRKSQELTLSADVIESLDGNAGAEVPRDLDTSVVRGLIDSLPDAARSAAILFFLEDMKMTEIADYLGISLPAVKSRVREARIRLQKEMIDMVKHAGKKDVPGDEFNESLKHRLELARYYRDMSSMFERGKNLRIVLHNLEAGPYSKEIREATSELIREIENGSTISEALKNLPALSAPGVIGMVRSGEVGGVLDWTVKTLADWIEVENAQRELELIYWCRTMGAASQAGAPTGMVLECGVDMARSKGLKQATREIIKAIDANESLIPVLDRYPDVFPQVVRTAIAVGERAGSVGYALGVAADTLASGIVNRLAPRGMETPTWWVDAEYYKRKEAFDREAVKVVSADSASERVTMASILRHIGSSEAVDALINLSNDADPNVRTAAINALVETGRGDASDAVISRLKDEDPSVRYAAARAVGELGLAERASEVAEAMADPETSVARAAVTSLIKMGEIGLLAEQAAKLLKSESGSTRHLAAWTLRNFPTPGTEDALIEAIQSGDYILIEWCAVALQRLGRKEGLNRIAQMLDSLTDWQKVRAANVLNDTDE